MKKIAFFVFILIFSGLYSQNTNCYTIAVGKNVSSVGYPLLAHNEDDWGDMIVNLYKVPALDNPTKYLPLGLQLPDNQTIGYIWFETTTENFGDFVINDYGVAIVSNACPSREDTAKGILKFDFRHLIVREAKTAKQAVRIAGKLLEKYGYGSSGRSYCIADNKEIWILAVVKGKHWVAQRVPDDQVAIVPNYYTIDTVNLADTLNFLGSKDLITYAEKRGWFNPENEKFSFRKVYGKTSVLYAPWNIPRHWFGINFLSEKKYKFYADLPFSFYPEKKISKQDLEKVLSSHFENTDLEVNQKIRSNPHTSLIHPVCNAGTKFSIIVEYAEKKDNTLIWFAPFNPCINPYIPISLLIDSFPSFYHKQNFAKAFENHFNTEENKISANKHHAYWVFERYNKKINSSYWEKYKDALKNKNSFEKKFQKIYNAKDKKQESEWFLRYFYQIRLRT